VAKKSAYIERKTAPSFQLIFSLERKYQKNKFVIIENMTRFWKTLMFICTGEPTSAGTKRVTPKISVMFTKLLPIMSPKASPECPLRNAFKSKVSSGRLVPKAITVAPIIC
jgi:hypothetical protein